MAEPRDLDMDSGQHKEPPPMKPADPAEAPTPLTPHHTVQMQAPEEAKPEDAGKTTSEDVEVRTEALLDKGIELSFPASDPVAPPDCAEVQEAIACHDHEEDLLDLAIELSFPASDPIAVSACHHVANDTLPHPGTARQPA